MKKANPSPSCSPKLISPSFSYKIEVFTLSYCFGQQQNTRKKASSFLHISKKKRKEKAYSESKCLITHIKLSQKLKGDLFSFACNLLSSLHLKFYVLPFLDK
ncbi:uncharacterized protein DS421_8g235330 [Arachis hypogaea]|nr:uncharacterized protein DS421_8g235330 [Arachis hypogaea]